MMHPKYMIRFAIPLVIILMIGGSPVAAKPNARITDLGTLPGDTASLARAINDQGSIVGESSGVGFETSCFINRNNESELINNQPQWTGNCITADVNNNNEVVGRVIRAPGQPDAGFLWRDGTITDLGFPDTYSVTPRAINNTGQIVGEMGVPTSGTGYVPRGFVWQNGSYIQLPCQALAVDNNDAGQVIAMNISSCPPGTPDYPRGLIWDNGNVAYLDFIPIAINNNGQVVGVKYLANTHTFVLWQNGVTSTLDLPFFPAKINDLGEIIGRSETNPETAMIQKGSSVTELPSLKQGQRTGALGMNNLGAVVGYNVIDDQGTGHGVVWSLKSNKR